MFMGTTVVAGTGKAVVYATGTATQFGRIFQLTTGAPAAKTPLQRQVAAMAGRVSVAALAIGAPAVRMRGPRRDARACGNERGLLVPRSKISSTLVSTLSMSQRTLRRRSTSNAGSAAK